MSDYKYIPPKPPLLFTLFWCALYGAIIGFFSARGNMQLALILIFAVSILFSILGSFFSCYN